MSIVNKPIRGSPTLETLYKDLDSYIKELDKQTTLDKMTSTATAEPRKRTHMAKQPSFTFRIAGVIMDDIEPSSTTTSRHSSDIQHNNTSNNTSSSNSSNSSGSNSNSNNALKQHRHPTREAMHINTNPIHLDLDTSSPSIAWLTELSKCFVAKVNALVESRDIFCSTEYPKSFTGEEAVDILHQMIGADWSRKDYRFIARQMMYAEPPLFVPIAYSDKSLKNNTLYDSTKEAYSLTEYAEMEKEFSQALLVRLMDCYTPLCVKGISNGCYAPTCPNRGAQLLSKSNIVNKDLQRNISFTSSLASSQDTLTSRCWASTVSRDTLQKTPSKEMKRQEAIYEFIYTEEDYVRDLNLLDELFAKPLLRAQCIEYERREEFCKEIFGNYAEITNIHRNMYRELRDHQLASQEMDLRKSGGSGVGFVDEITSIIIKYVDPIMKAYTEYGPHFLFAEYTARREMNHNILFQNFIREKEKQAETRKLPFRHFIILPITRLQRYPLLLDAILKRTTDESEQKSLSSCIDRIKEVAAKVNDLATEAKQKLRIREINDKIRFKPGHPRYNLDLLNPDRKLIYEGPMKRRSHLVVETVDLQVFLFDHLLLMTKPKRVSSSHLGEVEHYVVSKNPIPLDLLTVSDVAENFILGTFRSTKGLSNASTTTMSTLIPTSPLTPNSSSTPPDNSNSQYMNQASLHIRHLGRHGGEYILWTETPNARSIWKQNILKAQVELAKKEEPNNVFSVQTISDTTFASTGTLNNYGKVTCAAPFVGVKGTKMVVLGTQHGVWMGRKGDTNGLTRVLMLNDVTQIGVLESQNILLVLADKVLTAFPLAQLEPHSPSCISKVSNSKKPSEKSSGSFRVLANHAQFFNTGTCNGRTLVVTMKRKGPDSQFKAYEPICGDLNDSKNAKFLATKSSFMSKPPAWFKIYKEFYIGTDSSAVHFLKTKVLVACSRGFEVIDLDHLSEVKPNLPNLDHRDFNFVATAEAKPLSMFRCNENFLLCYDKFAFLITTHGDYVRKQKRIEWESNPQSVAFHYPYVLAFDHRFIEIRHVETGKLVQIIAGENTRLLPSSLNNTNTTATEIYGSISHQFKADYQHIFKLKPLFS